jgi:hypothetical protein
MREGSCVGTRSCRGFSESNSRAQEIARPSHRWPQTVQVVEHAFDNLVNAATPSFLATPPPEFLALHAILLRVATVTELHRS